jgi:deoxycytidylate deaminase
MDIGNAARSKIRRGDLLALIAASQIRRQRRTGSDGRSEPLKRKAHILSSLKRPEEVKALRKIYGAGFFLIGVSASHETRRDYLIKDKIISEDDAATLIARDLEEEKIEFGQRTRDTFYLADVFIQLDGNGYKDQLQRFLNLVFGHPYETPTSDEHAMYLAQSASLRSAQLGRQVGAAITSRLGDVIAVGCNEVPKAGGGIYGPGQDDHRDHTKGEDSNDRRKEEILQDAIKRLGLSVTIAAAAKKMKESLLYDITEFGRATHAEMEALLACTRNGCIPVDGTLYTTTFPCHNCTRHIIAAGIKSVVYIEPYPKSRAQDLHEDDIRIDDGHSVVEESDKRVLFKAFEGVGPRRYTDLFSTVLNSGDEIKRKRNGKTIAWKEYGRAPRVPLPPASYLQREELAVREISGIVRRVSREGI